MSGNTSKVKELYQKIMADPELKKRVSGAYVEKILEVAGELGYEDITAADIREAMASMDELMEKELDLVSGGGCFDCGDVTERNAHYYH